MIKDFLKFEGDLSQLGNLNMCLLCQEVYEMVEKILIEEALRRSKGRKGRAAKLLGVDVKTLYNKLRKINQKTTVDISEPQLQAVVGGK